MAAVISIFSSKFLIASLNFAEDRRTTWARKLKKVCKEKRMPEIYDIVEQRLVVHKSNAHYFPQDCGRKRDFKLARHLHIFMMQSGVASCCEQLIWLFTTCRCLAEANQVLDSALEVNVLSLGALISAHGNLGGGTTALDLYNTMRQLGQTDPCTYYQQLSSL